MVANTLNLRLLSQAVQQVSTVMETPAIIRSLVASAMELTGATGGAAGLMVEGRMVFTEYNLQGRITPIHYEFTLGYGAPGRVMATGMPYTSNDAANDPHVVADIQKVFGFQTLADVPIISRGGDLLGCFEIHNKAGGPFDDSDLDLLMVLAAAATGAIENAQLLLDRTAAMEASHKSVIQVSESRNMLRLVMDTIPVRVFWKDTELRYLGCNVHLAHDAGRGSPEELVGKTDYDMAWREQADLYRADDQEVISSGKAKLNYVEPQTTSDGRVIWLQTSKIPLRDTQGKIIGVFGSYEDITERKRAEQALRESEEKFSKAFRASPAVISVATLKDARYVEVNEAFESASGYSRQEVIGRSAADLQVFEDPRVMENLVRLLESGGSAHNVECRFRQKSGAILTFLVSAERIELGGQTCILSAGVDITERRRLLEQLQQINAELEQRVLERTAVAEKRASQLRVLAGRLTMAEHQERRRVAYILHEHFQQLLASAKFSLSIVRRKALDKNLREPLERVEQAIDESILASRSLSVELCPPILYDMGLAATLEWLGRWMHDRYRLNVEVQADPLANPQAEDIAVFLFHSTRELLFNIVKHAHADRATVRMSRQNHRNIQIVVADKGAGFDPSSPPSGRDAAGGFGLFSIRERIELVGGTMEIDSQPGGGTRISLTAPCASPKGPVPAKTVGSQVVTGGYAARQADQRTPQDQSVIRVLLADDHEVVRMGLTRLLQMEPDIEVVGQAADGLEALEIALQIQPDVILMDVSMPRMSGVEATQRIIQLLPSSKIIGLSMHEQEDAAVSMKAAGAAIYLTKTSPPEALIAAIRECTARTALVE